MSCFVVLLKDLSSIKWAEILTLTPGFRDVNIEVL